MKKSVVNVSLKDKMAFDVEVNGHKFTIDAHSEVGGEDRGPRPKPLLLAALGGCTSMDVVSILRKMRVDFKDVNVQVEGELVDEPPKKYGKIHVIYTFTGKDLPMEKLEKAVNLSEERYCGVSASLKGNVEITSEIKVVE